MTEVSEKIWRQFESLLEEAVMKNHNKGVEMLLQHENGDIMVNIPKYQAKTYIPLILAIGNKNVSIINIFRKHHYTLPEPHTSNCRCNNCKEDKLGKTRYRLLTLKALSNPVWISMVSDDPFLSLFQLCQWNKNFGKENFSFRQEYDDIYEEAMTVCLALLDEVRSESEGSILMSHKMKHKDEDGCCDLSFIVLAIDYEQKEVVAHPVVQHFLNSAVFDDIPGWYTSGIGYKIFLVFLTAILYPITTGLNILCPSSKCCGRFGSLGDIAMKPFVKFINGAASFITFLALLAVFGASEQIDGIRGGKWPPKAIEIVVFIWLAGFCFGECRQVYKNGISGYFDSGWNWVDIGMDSLMLLSYIAWIVLSVSFEEGHKHHHGYVTAMHVADGAFTFAIILSFFRIIYLCQITSYLGLLQLCFGQMIQVILQFSFICIIVLLAFTVGMGFLFHASDTGKAHIAHLHSQHDNHTTIYDIMVEDFSGFWSTLFTMIYVSLSMQGTETLKDFQDGSLIHLWSSLLFITYYGITMIVVLNMLIAMMNSSYQVIADNLSMEHLYSQSKLWLEYVGDEQTRPVPLNLIPTVRMVISWIWGISTSACCRNSKEKNTTLEEVERMKYKQVCDTLMERYMRKEFGFYTHDKALPATRERKNNDPFLQKINTYFEMWRQMISEGVEDISSFITGDIENMGYLEESPDGDRRYSQWIDMNAEYPTSISKGL